MSDREYTHKSEKGSLMILGREFDKSDVLVFFPGIYTPEKLTPSNSDASVSDREYTNKWLAIAGPQVKCWDGCTAYNLPADRISLFKIAPFTVWPQRDRVAATMADGTEIIRRRASNWMHDEYFAADEWHSSLSAAIRAADAAPSLWNTIASNAQRRPATPDAADK